MVVLSMKGIGKSFITNTVLEDVSFNVDSKDKIGLIGINGSGKTTLFNMIFGNLTPDTGEIYRSRDLSIGYLVQQIGIESELSVFEECLEEFRDLIEQEHRLRELEEEISRTVDAEKLERIMESYAREYESFQAANGYGYNSEIKGVLKGLGFSEADFDKEVNTLSGGQKSRLHLAKLLLGKPDILLLDEPTNHLDMEAISFLEGFLRSFNGAVLIISHDRYFLDRIVNRIFHLENKTLTSYNTDYSRFVIERSKMMEIRNKSYENQQREIKRQEEIIERFSNYGGARYIRQAQSRRKQLGKMVQIESFHEDANRFSLRFEPGSESGYEVLHVENAGKNFDGVEVFNSVSFDIYKRDRVGIIGPNGVGKTTLIKMIMDEIREHEGVIKEGTGVIKGYFDQEQQQLSCERSLIEEIWEVKPNMLAGEARNYLAAFGFTGDDVFKSINEMSGGEKGRVSLLKLMLSDANFLILDEPTNHLDIDSKEILESAIVNYEGTVLIISHDRYFLNKVTNKTFVMERSGITVYDGNYDYYLEKLSELNAPQDSIPTETKTSIKKKKKLQSIEKDAYTKIKKRIRELESEIANVDEEIQRLEKSSFEPEIYNDYQLAQEVKNDMDRLTDYRETLFEEWFELSEEE